MIGSFLVVALAATSPCPTPSGELPDRAAADEYFAVAEAELAVGAHETARAALCAALEADPAHARARALLELTGEGGPPPLEVALAHMKAGRWEEALAALRAAPAASEALARLLEGVCLVELGRLDAARAALEQARASPEQRELAEFHLGLLALQAGDTATAAARLDAVMLAEDDRLRRVVGDLKRLSRVEGRFTVLGGVFPGFDTNVDATPTGSVYAVSSSAPDLSLFGVLWARPLGRSGPFVRARAQHRALLRVTDFSATVLEASGGWNHVTRHFRVRAQYDFEALWLAGAGYRLSHAAQVAGDATFRTLTVSALWAGRRQDFLTAPFLPFSGWQHSGVLQLAWTPSVSFSAWLGWGYVHDLPAAPQLEFVETGPRLGLEVRPADALRLAVLVNPALRQYQAFDALLEATRQDLRLDAQLTASLQLLDFLALQAAAGTLVTRSNVSLFSFERFTASLGLVFALGVP